MGLLVVAMAWSSMKNAAVAETWVEIVSREWGKETQIFGLTTRRGLGAFLSGLHLILLLLHHSTSSPRRQGF
jgi:hypothetical protein